MIRNAKHILNKHQEVNTSYSIIKRWKNSNSTITSANYCFSLVKNNDYENFLPTLLVKGPDKRQCIFAVRAFNIEVAKIAGVVSDHRIAKMRLTFWHEALDKIFDKHRQGALPEHPVIEELNYAITKYNLPRQYFDRIINERERQPNTMFPTTKELEQYAEYTSTSLFYLILKIGGIASLNADHAISHLGKAQGICNLLRALPRYNLKERSAKAIPVVPQQILLQHGVSYERILRQKPDDKPVRNCIFDVASLANTHLTKSRNLASSLEPSHKVYLLSAIAIARYLERLRQCDFDLSHSSLGKPDGLLPLSYMWNYLRTTY